MKDVWYVVYETHLLGSVLTHFVGGFVDEKDAKAFLKHKNRENADSIRKGWLKFFIEERPLFK